MGEWIGYRQKIAPLGQLREIPISDNDLNQHAFLSRTVTLLEPISTK